MASFSYGMEPLTWPPGGDPPNCCTASEYLGTNVQYRSIGAQKAKCGTSPIVGLSQGDKGYPVYRQPAEGPKKYFLVVTETASGSCAPGPNCYGSDPQTSSGTKTSSTNPRSSGPYWAPCVVNVEGELHDDCGIWFYVNWSFNWSETSYTVNRSEGEPTPGYCKVLGSSTYSLELSEEFDTDMLEGIVGEMLAACSLDEMGWGENKIGAFRGEEMLCQNGSVSDGSGWGNSAYRKLRDDESMLTKRRIQYKVGGQVYPTSLEGNFRIQWREMFLPEVGEDEDPVPEFTDQEYSGYPDEEGKLDAGEFTIEPPETNGSILVVGLPAKGTISAQIEVKGWQLTKRGFLEYKPTGDKPRVFKRETASGSFAGCPAQNLDPKTYSGFQRFTDEAVTMQYPWGSYTVPASDDPTGNTETTLSEDVKKGGLHSRSFPGGGYFRFTMPVKQVTPTRRTFEEEITCDGNPVKNTLIFDLSEEYTTAEMVAAVEAECSKAWDDQSKKFLSEYNLENDWWDQTPIQAALLLQSTDEATYAKQQMRYKLTFSIPWSFATTKSFTFKWKIYTCRFDTGATAGEAMSQSVTFEDGNTVVADEDWREIPAPSTPSRVWIGGFDGPEHPLFYERDPKIERV